MLFLGITRAGNTYELVGKTDSGRTVKLNALDYKSEIGVLAEAVDLMEGSELREAQKENEKLRTENKALTETVETFKSWTRVWTAGESYQANEPLSYQGSLYISQKDHKATSTQTPDRDTTTYKAAKPIDGAAATF